MMHTTNRLRKALAYKKRPKWWKKWRDKKDLKLPFETRKYMRLVRRQYRVERRLSRLKHRTLRRTEQPSYTFRKRPALSLFKILLSQLLIRDRSKTSVITKLRELFCHLKTNQKSPITYINLFIKRALPKIFLRDYRMGSRHLLVPVPASYSRRRLLFVKQLLKDIGTDFTSLSFSEKLFAEIENFSQKKGQTYTRKIDTYIISKQNRNYSRYGYRYKSYAKKNVAKKNKFALI